MLPDASSEGVRRDQKHAVNAGKCGIQRRGLVIVGRAHGATKPLKGRSLRRVAYSGDDTLSGHDVEQRLYDHAAQLTARGGHKDNGRRLGQHVLLRVCRYTVGFLMRVGLS